MGRQKLVGPTVQAPTGFVNQHAGVTIVMSGYTSDELYSVDGDLLWVYAPHIVVRSEGMGYWDEDWYLNNNNVGSGTAWMRSVALDSDGDGVLDSVDNCLEAPNTLQIDTNGDGFGNSCDADINSDCVVNASDLGLLRAVFFSASADVDFNGDDIVNVVDLGIKRDAFFRTPGPSALASCVM